MYFESDYREGRLFINGAAESLSTDLAEAIPVLCDNPVLTAENLAEWIENSAFLEQIVAWINKGYWYLMRID